MNKNNQTIKNEIIDELINFGFNMKLKGTQYLLDSILFLYDKYNYEEYILEKDIYPIIARKYNKTINNIKCSVNYSFKDMSLNNKNIKKYLEYNNGRFPIKILIFKIIESLNKRR